MERYLTLVIYPLLLIPFFVIWYAQSRVRRVFREEDAVPNARGVTGMQVARYLLNQSGLYDVRIETLRGFEAFATGDHYNPITNVLRLSQRTAQRNSVLAVGVAAHEVGHALQDAQNYSLMLLRNRLARWLTVLGTISPLAFIGGFLFGNRPLMWIAVGISALQLLFALVTYPVERNATRRALQLLEEQQVIAPEEEGRVRRVLRAASFTYLAQVASRLAFFLFAFIVLATITGLGS